MGSADPLILSLQHFCLQDGPGIRSLVFFKGCPLRCAWCQNVESWKTETEIAFKDHLCINCGRCVDKCPERAIPEAGKRNAEKCSYCFTCTDNCPTNAMTRYGVPRSAEELVEDLRPEFPLFRTSGGGVTFTGGEPTLHPDYIRKLTALLRAEGITVALETCGFFNLEKLRPLLGELQLVLFDIKIFDEAQHRQLCGADNTVIKKNLRALVEDRIRQEGPVIWPRLPVVPGMTDGPDNIKSWAGFLRGLGLSSLTLVPYHPMGANKRRWLGLPRGSVPRVPTEAELDATGQIFSSEGIRVYKPGDEDAIRPALSTSALP